VKSESEVAMVIVIFVVCEEGRIATRFSMMSYDPISRSDKNVLVLLTTSCVASLVGR
jgi:hypothetical protein